MSIKILNRVCFDFMLTLNFCLLKCITESPSLTSAVYPDDSPALRLTGNESPQHVSEMHDLSSSKNLSVPLSLSHLTVMFNCVKLFIALISYISIL